MLELGVFSEGKHFMDMMHLPKRSHQAGPAIVGQDGAACVVVPGRRRMLKQRKRKRNQNIGKHPSRFMLLKILKRELKVNIASCYHVLYKFFSNIGRS